MRYFILVGGFIFLLMSAFTSWNGFTIHGRVTDEAGNALPNVVVQVKGATTATVTDGSGAFSLKIPNDSAVLVITAVGYTLREVTVRNEGKPVSITLQAQNASMQEVVVVGYQSMRKRDVTGSVTTVKGKEIKSKSSSSKSVNESLQGRVAGVAVNAPTKGKKEGKRGEELVRRNGGYNGIRDNDDDFNTEEY